MKEKPCVGDVVRLNDYGCAQICGIPSMEAARQAQRMVVTYVTRHSLTSPEQTWGIEVDSPLIGKYLIDNHCVDLIRKGRKD